MIQIYPSDFSKSSARAIEDFINDKYADKVIHKVGLCVGFHSIISTSEGLIGHGSGIVNVNVDFRVVVFRPFKGEIVQGTITDSHMVRGILLSQDFFEDIVVPPEVLFDDTAFGADDAGVELFIWRPKDPETGKEAEDPFYIDRAEVCLFRVEKETWRDLSPQMQRPDQSFVAEQQAGETGVRQVPYLVEGSMMLSGLGPTFWWNGEGPVTDGGAEGVNGNVNGEEEMVSVE